MTDYSLRYYANAVGISGMISARAVAAAQGLTGQVSLRAMMTLPRAPVQMAPQGGGNAIRDPVLQWRDPGVPNYNQGTKYAVTFPPSFQSEIAAPATSVVVSQVLYFGASYGWTVQAINEHGSSPLSSATFSTQGPPAPTNLSPSNEVNVIVPATLTWIDVGAQLGSPALQFQLQIYQGTLEAPLGSPQPFVTQQSNFTVPLLLIAGQTYTWSVTAQYPPPGSISGLSLPSSPAQFLTLEG